MCFGVRQVFLGGKKMGSAPVLAQAELPGVLGACQGSSGTDLAAGSLASSQHMALGSQAPFLVVHAAATCPVLLFCSVFFATEISQSKMLVLHCRLAVWRIAAHVLRYCKQHLCIHLNMPTNSSNQIACCTQSTGWELEGHAREVL